MRAGGWEFLCLSVNLILLLLIVANTMILAAHKSYGMAALGIVMAALFMANAVDSAICLYLVRAVAR